ncbi:hypothetical protein F2Q69_00027672 [Brassica cretica]|uniref:Uncharacterized protein n=1 Tax=Brassica cretica TaxID=69181 RepID=A0A8S9RWV1_BRACR|nr:hypothetical protein F2Q69_00027672 [Brassica cretica]
MPVLSSQPQSVRKTRSQPVRRDPIAARYRSRPDDLSSILDPISSSSRRSAPARDDQLQLATINKQSVHGSSLVGGTFNPS